MLNESMLSLNRKYVVGVSGGPDSMALLDMLHKKGYWLIVCLVNYHKREDSDLDYHVVKEYCESHQIPLAYKEIFMYEKGNFQAQAREMRYDFYLEVANLYMCEGVLLAHHFDDYLETVLMQQERNQEDGFWGISETSSYNGLNVLRPLLSISKNQLVNYCEKENIEYRIDSSNLECDYRRNYFRNKVLKNYSALQKENLYRIAIKHNEDYHQLVHKCHQWIEKNVSDCGFSYQEFLKFENQNILFKHYLYKYTDIPASRISKKLIDNCLFSLKSKEGNIKINLPVNFLLIKEYDNIYVTKIQEDSCYCFVIKKDEYNDYGYFKISQEGHDRCGVALKEVDFPITIRNYQQGDAIELSYGTKKVSRLFIDAKVPNHLRKKWPIVLNAKGEIILIPKIAKNNAYLLAKPTWYVIQ